MAEFTANGRSSQVTADVLQHMIFPPLKFMEQGLVTQGLTVCSGNPKVYKSFFCVDLCSAVATGGECLGRECAQSPVLYLTLEDTLRRVQDRMTKVFGFARPWPLNLEFNTKWPRLDRGGLDELNDWLRSVGGHGLVVIDTLGAVRAPKKPNQTLYDAETETGHTLKALADETDSSILVVHHNRKAPSESGDPFERVSGSFGVTSSADTVLVIDKTPLTTSATLYGRGRDIDEFELAMEFSKESYRWAVIGDAGVVRRETASSKVLDALRSSADPMTAMEIRDRSGASYVGVRQALVRLVEAGEVARVGIRLYAIPPHNVTTANEVADSKGLPESDTACGFSCLALALRMSLVRLRASARLRSAAEPSTILSRLPSSLFQNLTA